MAKTTRVRIFPVGWEYPITFEGDISFQCRGENEVRFSIRTQLGDGVEVKTVATTLPYVIEEIITHSGTISV